MIGHEKTGLEGSTARLGTWLSAAMVAVLSLAACATGSGNTGGSSPTTTDTGATGGGGTTTTSSTTGTDTGTDTGSTTTTTTTSTSSNTWPCGQDCSKIQTKQCLMAVCNMGEYLGPVGTCTVVEAPAGTSCDDGQFCTVGDACDGAGVCQGNAPNDCGMAPPECSIVICDELTKSCGTQPADDGVFCTPTDLCMVNGVCTAGACVGEAKDCSFSPLSECNTVACNPTTGACEGTADTSKNGAKCTLSGDLCQVNRVCADGACAGGTAKDCSALTQGCNNGVCDPTSGACVGQPVPAGGTCYDGIDNCHVGTCDASSNCVAAPLPDGTACNDSNPCTTGDVCTGGVCGGVSSTGCHMYMAEGFETCPAGWTLGGDWQCGTPSVSGPATAHAGHGVIATQLAGSYNSSQSYTTCTADSPVLDLSTGTNPKLSFWAWIDTEGSSYDGFNLKATTNGTTWTTVTGVLPAYNLTVNNEPAWGGHQSAAGWQHFTADLTPFVGQSNVKVRFAFRSDSIGNYPGVYIDDILIAEPSAIQLVITTNSLGDAIAGNPYAGTVARTGGSPQAAWSIIGGTNSSWMSINPTTGVLGGTPTAANIGPVTVALQVQELAVPGNIATKTFSFNVVSAIHYQGFEGACPNGWTLAGDWQCGAPTSGPGSAFGGTNVLATQLGGNYSASMAWDTCTATSPAIDLSTAQHPKLTFRMWIDTEGSSYDGANLKLSTDGGTTWSIVSNVQPAYSLTISSETAWGGHQASSGWQLVQSDLSAYVGQSVRIRFAFRSDSLVQYPGVYIDDVMVTDH